MSKTFYTYEDERIKYVFPDEKKMLLEIFEEYNFKDNLGNPLTRCLPFLKLVQFYYYHKNLDAFYKLNKKIIETARCIEQADGLAENFQSSK